MITSPFRVAPPMYVTVEVAAEPVLSALVSLSFLNAAGQVPADLWVAETAAALSEGERHRNHLVFEGLGEALLPAQSWPDFAAYLAGLAAEDAQALRGRMLARLARPAAGLPAPDPAQLLADVDVFAAHVERLYASRPSNDAILAEVHALLNDPPAMQALIVGHLRALWERHLAPEWQRRHTAVEWLVQRLRRREWPAVPASEIIRSMIGRDLPPAIAGQLDGVERVILVVSPHVGPWASHFGSTDTIWVFVRDHREALPMRDAPATRAGLLGPLSALADDTRLHILELLAQHDELPAQEIIAALGLSQSNVSRHLKQLYSAGFLAELRKGGASKSYRLNRSRVDAMVRALNQLLEGNAMNIETTETHAGPPAPIARFLDAAGRVKRWTKKHKDQMLLLEYLVQHFELGREYSEAEVNALLNQWHTFTDPAVLRRYMYEEGMLGRTANGARYWRVAREG